MFPFTYRFAARAPCDSKGSGCPGVSVESIQPRPPQPCEVGRPKGRRRKNRRQSHNFFKHLPSGSHPSPSLHLCCKPLECLDLGEKSDGGPGESASKCPDCYVKQIYFHFDLRWLS